MTRRVVNTSRPDTRVVLANCVAGMQARGPEPSKFSEMLEDGGYEARDRAFKVSLLFAVREHGLLVERFKTRFRAVQVSGLTALIFRAQFLLSVNRKMRIVHIVFMYICL